jgi:hypothetical protein
MKKKSIGIIIIYIGLFSILFPFRGTAQPYIDILNIKYRSFPATSQSEIAGNAVKGSLAEATITLPLVLKNKNVILIGGDYSQLNFNTSPSHGTVYSLYSSSLLAGFDQQLKNPAWRRTVLFLPKFNGDYKSLSRSFQPGGVIMYTFKKKDNLKYHFGLYYNREFFGDYMLPLVGIDWKINSRMNLFGDLPNNLSFEIKLIPAITVGTGFTTNIASYRVHTQNELSYFREGDKSLGHDQLKLYLNYHATKNIVAFVEAGETINRMYTGYDSNDKVIPSGNIPAKDGMFLTGGVAYRFDVE